MDGALSHWKCADKWDIRNPRFGKLCVYTRKKDTLSIQRRCDEEKNQTKLTAQLRETKYGSLKSGAKKMLTASAVVS